MRTIPIKCDPRPYLAAFDHVTIVTYTYYVISPHSGGEDGWPPQPVLQGLVSVVIPPDQAVLLAPADVLLPLLCILAPVSIRNF